MKPKLICLTPVRNEAWCLDVFLQCASLWADHIIIADQNSTDGSREIAKKYDKVILIENNDGEMHQAKARGLLFEEGRKIPGSKVFIALDTDELFTHHFLETADWKKIVESVPGQLFYFKWANVQKDKKTYWIPDRWMLWGYHDDGTEFPVDKYIHEWRMPWPKNSVPQEIFISDFQVMHLSTLNWRRTISKARFYQCVTKIKEPKISFVSFYRQYHGTRSDGGETLPFNETLISYYEENGIKVFDELKLNEPCFWFDLYVIDLFKKYGLKKFKYLDIWDKQWMNEMKDYMIIEDPRNLFTRSVYAYLKISQKFYPGIIVKAMDKVISLLVSG